MNKKQTLYEEELEDYFLKNIENNNFPSTKKVYFSEDWYISASSDKNKIYKYFFELRDHYIFCKKSKNSKEIAFMNIKNSFIKLLPQQDININGGTKVYGIKFIKKKIYEELYSENEELIKKIFHILKRYCVLSKFRLYFSSKKLLGKGNFAKVFLVERKEDNQEFACKIFDKNFILSDPMEKKCMLYEIMMMKEMKHHRLCQLYELYEGENYIYCLQELYRGQTLQDAIIKKGSQPEKKALLIIQQIIEGLHFIHEKKIIHRDLKPENIIFKDEDNSVNLGIVDFGFATYEEDYKKLFTRCGTPGYVAPEVLNDKPYNCKADIFSCGVIFYMILLGKVPFNGNSYKEIVLKNMKGEIDFDMNNFNVTIQDLEILDLLKWLLEIKPEKRPSAELALQHKAFDLLEAVSPVKKGKTMVGKNFFNFNKDIKEVKRKLNKPIPGRIEDFESPDNSPVAIKKKKPNNFEILLEDVQIDG